MRQIDDEFANLYEKIGASFGMDRLLMRVFALTYIEPGEISLDDLATKTGYSLASISNKAKTLESMGLAEKRSKPGTRKVYLFVKKDFGSMIKEYLIRKESMHISLVKKQIPLILQDYHPRTAKDKQKMKILRDYYEQMLRFERLIKDILKRIDT